MSNNIHFRTEVDKFYYQYIIDFYKRYCEYPKAQEMLKFVLTEIVDTIYKNQSATISAVALELETEEINNVISLETIASHVLYCINNDKDYFMDIWEDRFTIYVSFIYLGLNKASLNITFKCMWIVKALIALASNVEKMNNPQFHEILSKTIHFRESFIVPMFAYWDGTNQDILKEIDVIAYNYWYRQIKKVSEAMDKLNAPFARTKGLSLIDKLKITFNTLSSFLFKSE